MTLRRGCHIVVYLVTLGMPLAGALAEEIRIPLGQQGAEKHLDLPARGTSKAHVEARFGAAQQQQDPIGTPPISSWIYPAFTVYFENDRVIHAVIRHTAPTNEHSE